MTLLSCIQDSADAIGLVRPGTVIGSSAGEVQKLLRASNKSGVRLMKSFPWQALRTERTFTSVSGSEQTSILPSDFDRFIAETFWDRTNITLLDGPIGAVEWQSLKANGYAGYERKFTYRGDSVFVIPDAAAGNSYAFEYVSKNWCQTSASAGKAAWTADTDTGILSEELLTLGTIYEYLVAENLPADAAGMAYMEMADMLSRNDRPAARVLVSGDIFMGSRHFDGTPAGSGGQNINVLY